jgi:HD superfamily phosphohydrolase YqeK
MPKNHRGKTMIKKFKLLAIRSLRRSIKKHGKAKTREIIKIWKPENPNFLDAWEEAIKEVLK